jgi:hypothetical protein
MQLTAYSINLTNAAGEACNNGNAQAALDIEQQVTTHSHAQLTSRYNNINLASAAPGLRPMLLVLG